MTDAPEKTTLTSPQQTDADKAPHPAPTPAVEPSRPEPPQGQEQQQSPTRPPRTKRPWKRARKSPVLPRLASDFWRNLAALAFSLVFAFPLNFLETITDGVVGELQSFVIFTFLGWAVFGLFYFWLTHRTFAKAEPRVFERWIRESNGEKRPKLLVTMVSGHTGMSWAVEFSVLAVIGVATIAALPTSNVTLPVVASGLALAIGSWMVTIVSFAISYARQNVHECGLRFPDTDTPAWHDYLYLAIQISTTFASSDVEVLNTTMRKMVTKHTLIAFLFNTVLIAILVSILMR